MRRDLIGIILLVVSFYVGTGSAWAQKKFKTKGEAQIRVENNMTRDDARKEVRQLAIVNAIENVLGTYVEQETNIDIVEGQTNFKILGNTKVKGEWLETKDEKFEEFTRQAEGEFGDETEIWISCRISGVVREIVKPKLAFQAQSLNCPQVQCRTEKYYRGEYLYLYFRTPTDGYLTIYLQDPEAVYRLLPYGEMMGQYLNAVPVRADREYLFFSNDPQHDYFPGFPTDRVDELEMWTEYEKEYVNLYVIFSTVPFNKPILNAGKVIHQGMSLPKSLTTKAFNAWIKENRMFNPEFHYEDFNLEIMTQ
jgi:hypothetical protein